MDRQDIVQQTEIEHELLKRLIEGLRTTAGWQTHGPDGSRKLSTLRFVTQSLQRHLDRLLTLEERDGYMDLVVTCAPRLGRVTDLLRGEHQKFRQETQRINGALNALEPQDGEGLERVCRDLVGFLGRLEAHGAREFRLIQEALASEDGGEGG